MARTMALCSLPRTNPGNRTSVCQARQRPLSPWYMNATNGGLQTPLRQSTPPDPGLGVHRSGTDPKPCARSWATRLAKFMRELGVYSSGGGNAGIKLRNQMKRLFDCTVQLTYKDENGEVAVNSLIARRTEFWWNERKPDQPSLWESKIYLGEAFFNEIIRHPVPIEINTLTALKRSTLGLDLYLWLVYRTFPLRAPLRLSWRQVYRQFGVDPAKDSDKRTVLNFRTKVLRELKKIKLAWPELNYATAPGVLILSPSKPAIAPTTGPQRLVE